MRYLKTFESSKQPLFTIVDFTGGGDGVTALYIDGILFKYGDWHHDKIDIWIESFIRGVKWSDISIVEDKFKCDDIDLISDISEDGGIPPMNLSDFYKK